MCLIVVLSFAESSISQSARSINRGDDSLSAYKYPDYVLIDTNVHNQYPFIDFSKNNYTFYTETSPNFVHLYHELDSMIRFKDRKLNFYHIGGSHIQADIYSNDMRMFLQTNYRKVGGERGIVFPFDLAGTNNPGNYEFSSPNKWRAYRSVVNKDPSVDYGLMGATIMCDDSIIEISYRHDRTVSKPSFSKIRIYHNKGELPFELNFGSDEILVWKIKRNEAVGYTDVTFTDPLDTFNL